MLSGFTARACLRWALSQNHKGQNAKVTRFSPLSAQCEAGNVKVVRAKWNDSFFAECENFPEATHDDQPDSAAGGFEMLARPQKVTAGAPIFRRAV